MQPHALLNILQILLQHQNIQPHALRAPAIDSLHQARIADQERIDQQRESGADECDFFVAEETRDGFVVGGELGVEGENDGVGLEDFLREDVGGGVRGTGDEDAGEEVDDLAADFEVQGEEDVGG
jgi:hypothetical protein